jgi:hypothetical protein
VVKLTLLLPPPVAKAKPRNLLKVLLLLNPELLVSLPKYVAK